MFVCGMSYLSIVLYTGLLKYELSCYPYRFTISILDPEVLAAAGAGVS